MILKDQQLRQMSLKKLKEWNVECKKDVVPFSSLCPIV